MALLVFDKNRTAVHSGIFTPVVSLRTVRVIVFVCEGSLPIAERTFSMSASLAIPSSLLAPRTTLTILYSFPKIGCSLSKSSKALASLTPGISQSV